MSKRAKTAPPPLWPASEVRDRCLCLHAQRVARALARRFDEALRPFGLTSGQFSLLTALGAPQPPSIGEAAGLLAMDRTTVTAALKPLLRRGLAEMAGDAKDRRVKRARLTGTGRERLAAATMAWREAHQRLDDDLAAAGTDPALLRRLSADLGG